MMKLYESYGRNRSIDIMKGIGILLLLLSHSISGDSLLKTWIFSFHMPLFFWCTGFLFAEKYKSDIKHKLKYLISRKIVSVLVPYVVFSLAIVMYSFLLEFLHSNTFNYELFVSKIDLIVKLRGIDSLWFLPVFLIAEIVFLVVLAYMREFGLCLVFAISLAVNVIFNNRLPVGIAGALIRSSTGFMFICLGYLYKNLRDLSKNVNITISHFLIDAIFMILGAFLSLYNGFAAIGSYQFGNVFLYLICAWLTLMGLHGLCEKCGKLQIIPFYGKNSIVILCTNNIVIEILRLADSKLCGNWCLTHGMLGNFIFALLLTLIEFPIIIVGMKYFKCLFGVFSNKKVSKLVKREE